MIADWIMFFSEHTTLCMVIAFCVIAAIERFAKKDYIMAGIYIGIACGIYAINNALY